MEKVWFVHVKNYHLGPYSQKEVEGLIKKGGMPGDQKVWKEGQNDWQYLSEVSDFAEFKHLLKKERSTVGDPFLLPRYERFRKIKVRSSIRVIKTKASKFKVKMTTLALAIFFLVIFGVSLLMTFNAQTILEGLQKPQELPWKEFKKLKSVVHIPHEKGWHLRYKYKLSPLILWIGTNASGLQGGVRLDLVSVPHKILSERRVSLTSESVMRGNVIQFDTFQFHEGHKIISGRYDLTLTPLKEEDRLKWGTLKKRLYLGKIPVAKFSEKLKLFSKKVLGKKEFYYHDLQEKVRTLESVFLSYQQYLLTSLKGWRSPREVNGLLALYKRRFGLLLTQIILDCEKSSSVFHKTRPKVSEHFYELAVIGKSFSKENLSFLEKIKAKKKITRSSRKALLLTAKKMFKKFNMALKGHLKNIPRKNNS